MPTPEIYESMLSQLRGQARPRPDLGSDKPVTMMGRVVVGNEPIESVLQRFPQGELEGGSMAMDLLPTGLLAAGMAKRMLAGPTTPQGYLQQLAKSEEFFPSRGRLIPVIRNPATNELFEGPLGGQHPTEVVIQALTKRSQEVPGNLQYGYRPDYEGAPFFPEAIANYLLSNKTQTKTIADLLATGRSDMDSLARMINEFGASKPQPLRTSIQPGFFRKKLRYEGD